MNPARLTIAPRVPTEPVEPGLHPLGLGTERDGVIYVPDTPGPHPVLIALHGATMNGRQMVRPLLAAADDTGVALVVPESRRETWDVLLGDFGPDVEFINRAIASAFARCDIDPAHVAVGGVSDGASYALSLGLANGDSLGRIVAFSPGFVAPPELVGKPAVFLSHGVRDPILPIDACGRPIAAGLKNSGYDIEYLEFDGGHEMPELVVHTAFRWLTADRI